MDTIGNRLNGLLSEHDLSQRELSAEINVAHGGKATMAEIWAWAKQPEKEVNE